VAERGTFEPTVPRELRAFQKMPRNGVSSEVLDCHRLSGEDVAFCSGRFSIELTRDKVPFHQSAQAQIRPIRGQFKGSPIARAPWPSTSLESSLDTEGLAGCARAQPLEPHFRLPLPRRLRRTGDPTVPSPRKRNIIKMATARAGRMARYTSEPVRLGERCQIAANMARIPDFPSTANAFATSGRSIKTTA
jgi:hypothetical protein